MLIGRHSDRRRPGGGKPDLCLDPRPRAVGFTGKPAGGRAPFDLCPAGAEPIPFLGELGSVNPMFLLPIALAARGRDIVRGWAASLPLGGGPFRTDPGVAVVLDGPDADAFVTAAKQAEGAVGPQTMLTDAIAAAFRAGRDRVAAGRGVRAVLSTMCKARKATPCPFAVSGADWPADHMLGEQVFGRPDLIVRARHAAEMQEIARSLQGQLSCTLLLDEADMDLARALMPVRERKAGRILANGFPTGVEVVDAQVHGGPDPASTDFGASSVGTLSIRRWLRPVAYRNMPDALLPLDRAPNGGGRRAGDRHGAH